MMDSSKKVSETNILSKMDVKSKPFGKRENVSSTSPLNNGNKWSSTKLSTSATSTSTLSTAASSTDRTNSDRIKSRMERRRLRASKQKQKEVRIQVCSVNTNDSNNDTPKNAMTKIRSNERQSKDEVAESSTAGTVYTSSFADESSMNMIDESADVGAETVEARLALDSSSESLFSMAVGFLLPANGNEEALAIEAADAASEHPRITTSESLNEKESHSFVATTSETEESLDKLMLIKNKPTIPSEGVELVAEMEKIMSAADSWVASALGKTPPSLDLGKLDHLSPMARMRNFKESSSPPSSGRNGIEEGVDYEEEDKDMEFKLKARKCESFESSDSSATEITKNTKKNEPHFPSSHFEPIILSSSSKDSISFISPGTTSKTNPTIEEEHYSSSYNNNNSLVSSCQNGDSFQDYPPLVGSCPTVNQSGEELLQQMGITDMFRNMFSVEGGGTCGSIANSIQNQHIYSDEEDSFSGSEDDDDDDDSYYDDDDEITHASTISEGSEDSTPSLHSSKSNKSSLSNRSRASRNSNANERYVNVNVNVNVSYDEEEKEEDDADDEEGKNYERKQQLLQLGHLPPPPPPPPPRGKTKVGKSNLKIAKYSPNGNGRQNNSPSSLSKESNGNGIHGNRGNNSTSSRKKDFSQKKNHSFYEDPLFMEQFIEEITQKGIDLTWHQAQTYQQPKRVKCSIELGRCGHDAYAEPKLVWRVQVESGSNVNPYMMKTYNHSIHSHNSNNNMDDSDCVKVELFDIISIEKAGVMNFHSYPFAIPSNSFFVSLSSGGIVLFEAKNPKEQERITHGLTQMITRLTYNLIAGDIDICWDLFACADSMAMDDISPGSLTVEELDVWFISKAMNDVTHRLVEKSSMQAIREDEV